MGWWITMIGTAGGIIWAVIFLPFLISRILEEPHVLLVGAAIVAVVYPLLRKIEGRR